MKRYALPKQPLHIPMDGKVNREHIASMIDSENLGLEDRAVI